MTKQTTNKKLHSKSVLRQIRLLRVSEEITQEILAFLEKVDSDLAEQLAQRLVNIKTRGVLPKTYTNKRLLQLYKYVHKAIQSQSKDMYTILSPKLIDIANNEIGFQVKDITEALPIAVDVVTPPKAMLSAVVTTNPLQGKVLKDWVAGWAEGKEVRVLEEIRKGIVEGQTAETIVTRIRGTQKTNFADGILSISGRGARSLVRTTVNGVATAARELLYTNNKDIVKGVQWVSTLDSRTSPICRSRDGKVYPVDSGPRPPAHYSCRSTTCGVLKSWKELGIDLDEVPIGTRPAVVNGVAGDVPETLTYAEWLKEQSEDIQKEVLGKKRFEMFKNGATLDSFVDEKTGKQKKL